MRPLVTLRKAFADPNLLAPVMAGDSREAMRAILLASQGEALTPREREHWRRLTGRDAEPLARSEECHIIAGRRSGKTSGCAALATYASALCDYSDRLSPGERGLVLLVAENQRQAQSPAWLHRWRVRSVARIAWARRQSHGDDVKPEQRRRRRGSKRRFSRSAWAHSYLRYRR